MERKKIQSSIYISYLFYQTYHYKIQRLRRIYFWVLSSLKFMFIIILAHTFFFVILITFLILLSCLLNESFLFLPTDFVTVLSLNLLFVLPVIKFHHLLFFSKFVCLFTNFLCLFFLHSFLLQLSGLSVQTLLLKALLIFGLLILLTHRNTLSRPSCKTYLFNRSYATSSIPFKKFLYSDPLIPSSTVFISDNY